MTPPILEEIRRVRHEMSAEWGHDPRRMLEYFGSIQKEFPGKVVNFGAQETVILKGLLATSEETSAAPQS